MWFQRLKQIVPQPSVAILLAGGVFWLTWHLRDTLYYQWVTLDLNMVLLCIALAVGSIIADSVTIHLNYHTKTTIGSTVLVLIVVLLPPILAFIVVLLSMPVVLMIHRRQRGLYWSDIITDCCRLAIVGFVASSLAAYLAPSAIDVVHFGVPALAILIGDCVTMALLIAPISAERPFQVIRTRAGDLLLVDGPQYLLAVPVAVVATHAPSALPLLLIPLAVVYQVFRSRYHLQDNTRALLEQMADMVDLRDPCTGGHSRRVAEYSTKILAQLGHAGEDADMIINAARIHDIGKIGIPDSVLNNPGRLTDAERQVMEMHPVLGADLLLRYQDFARGVAIVRHHHERIDGNGYPSRLAGHDIPFGARVIAVADTWDALTSDRPYRRGMPPEQAAAILCAGRGTQWSAELVDALLVALGYATLLDNSRIADSLQAETATAAHAMHPLQAAFDPTSSHHS